MESKEWKYAKLSEYIEINPRILLKKGEVAKKVAMEHINEFTRKIQGYEITEFKSGSKFRNKDTLMARITPCLENGKTAYVNILDKDESAFGSTEFFVLRAKEGKADPLFVYYLAISKEIRNVAIKSMTGTSGRQRAQKEALMNYEMNFPPLDIQYKIGQLLSRVDEKIELNTRIISNLEQLAQTLFKYWFVDFEFPNENGEPYKSSGGKMTKSELGDIPEGWEVDRLGNVISIIDNRGKTPPLAQNKTEFPIIDVKALSGEGRLIDYSRCAKYVNQETYENWFRSGHPVEKDILISTVGSVGEMKIFMGNIGCIAQNVVAFRSKISPLYLYQYLKNIQKDLISYNIGSVQPSIKVTHIVKQKVLKPQKHFEEEFEKNINIYTSMIFNCKKENNVLKKLRDTLLPRLLSGELELPDESMVTDDVPIS